MRELIQKIIAMGFAVVFTADEHGDPCISVYHKGEDSHKEKPKLSCVLTPGTFQESSEAVLQDFIKTLQKRV